MKNFVLFLMFFVSQPAPPGKQVWTLSSTTHFEFSTMQACVAFGNHLQQNFPENADASQTPKPPEKPKPGKGPAVVHTTLVRGWCVDTEKGDSTADLNPNKHIYDIAPVTDSDGN